ASNSPQTAGVSGTGIASPSLSPSPVPDFGNQSVGITSTAKAIRRANASTAVTTITRIPFTGNNHGDFGQTNNCPISPSTLAANGTCAIILTFPPAPTATLFPYTTLFRSASNSPQTAGVSGTGIASPSLSPSPVPDFGNQSVGITSTAK